MDLPNNVSIIYYHRYWCAPINVILVWLALDIVCSTFSHEYDGSWTVSLPATGQILGNAECLLGRMLCGSPSTKLLTHVSNSDFEFQFQLQYFWSYLLCNFDLLNVRLRIQFRVSSWISSYHKIDIFSLLFVSTTCNTVVSSLNTSQHFYFNLWLNFLFWCHCPLAYYLWSMLI